MASLIDRDALVGARWFAGKDREVAGVHAIARVAPRGAEGAAVELVDVVYADGGSERYALPVRGGHECPGDDPLWAALAGAAGVEARTGRFLADDLSNTVVLLDDAWVLKLYRRPEPGIHPEVELLRALAGSPHAPELEGWLDHDGATLLSVQAFVSGEPVGWEPLVDRLAAGDSRAGIGGQLATVTASLHATLAERLGVTDEGRQRIHGDLNVGQFVRGRDSLVVVDWEGRPDLSLAERREPAEPLRDLASLRLSLAHAARAAHRRTPGFDWRAWSVRAREEALRAFGPVDVDRLHALEVEQELVELEYAKRWLPEWLYVPRDVLPFIEGAP